MIMVMVMMMMVIMMMMMMMMVMMMVMMMEREQRAESREQRAKEKRAERRAQHHTASHSMGAALTCRCRPLPESLLGPPFSAIKHSCYTVVTLLLHCCNTVVSKMAGKSEASWQISDGSMQRTRDKGTREQSWAYVIMCERSHGVRE
jgi:C4-dicarboxylate-specific signal transduction histidine kinase